MTENEIINIINEQNSYFLSGATLNINGRLDKLKKLYTVIKENEEELYKALKTDLNKAPFEAYESEIGFVLEELRYTIKHLRKWLKTEKTRSPLKHFPSKSYIYKEPYGVVLIMSPWNYPFQLTMVPLIAAIACGNCCVVKPSKYSEATSILIEEIVNKVFSKAQCCVIQGGREENTQLLNQKFDYIFFTGSPNVGKIVMEKASNNLTPITLELGGKSPCIVDNTANIKLSAKRIAWGKLLNAGQTCIAPDYVLVQENVKEELTKEIINSIKEMYGNYPLFNEELPKIVSAKHYNRLMALMQNEHIAYGGTGLKNENKIEPTILDQVTWNSSVMGEEIFGPILPIISFTDYKSLVKELKQKPKSLALYLFTTDKNNEKLIMDNISFGGGCVNDAIIHIFSSIIPFGGVGNSGMGQYHGKTSIETFSHKKSVMKKSNLLDIPLRYPPYKNHLKLLKKIIK